MNQEKISDSDIIVRHPFVFQYFKLIADEPKIREKCFLEVLEYIGMKYFKDSAIRASHHKKGIIYIARKAGISKTAVKLWYHSIKKGKYERVLVHKHSDKIFNCIAEIERSDAELQEIILKYDKNHKIGYGVLAPHHEKTIRSFTESDPTYYGFDTEGLRGLKRNLEKIEW